MAGQDKTVLHPLFDTEVEAALLGAFLVNPANIAIAKPLVEPIDFHHELHQLIAATLYEFDEEDRPINPLTLNAWIKHNPVVVPEAQKLFGESLPSGREIFYYLSFLVEAAPALPNIANYADIVAEFAQRRLTRDVLNDAQWMLAASEDVVPKPILSVLAPVVAIADEITSKQVRQVETRAVHLGFELLRQIDRQAVAKEKFSLTTGLDTLDQKLGGGFDPENLIILAGRPSMGKSLVATNLLRTAAFEGYAADYWSVEMPAREVLARLQADLDYDMAIREGLSPMEYRHLVKMTLSPGEMQRAALANELLGPLDINVFANPRVTLGHIAAVSRSRKAAQPDKKRLVVIDHLHILTGETPFREGRVAELTDMTKRTKELAKRIEAPVVLLSQLSRELERRDDKHPLLSDLRESGSIEQDADVVIMVYRHEYYAKAAIRAAKNDDQRQKALAELEATKNVLELDVAKQRSGETGIAKVYVDVNSSVVRSGDPRETMTAAAEAARGLLV